MPVLLEHYNPAVYANLKELEDVNKEVNEHQMQAVLDVIRKYGYDDKLCVIKAHKHHVLADNEAMMDGDRKNDSIISTPWPLEEIVKKGAKPSVIVLGEGKCFYPITYAMLGEKDVQAWSDSDFLNAIATLLLEKGLADKLMLGIMAGEPGVKYIEWNNFEHRSSELCPIVDGIVPADAIKTAYGFNNEPDGNGNMVPIMGCIVICVNCSHSHGTRR